MIMMSLHPNNCPQIYSVVGGNPRRRYNHKEPLPANQWTQMNISQTREDGIYVYKVVIDGDTVEEVENDQVEYFYDVKVYAANPLALKRAIKNGVILDGGIKDLVIGMEEVKRGMRLFTIAKNPAFGSYGPPVLFSVFVTIIWHCAVCIGWGGLADLNLRKGLRLDIYKWAIFIKYIPHSV